MSSSSIVSTNVTEEVALNSSSSNNPTKTKRSRHDYEDSNGSSYSSEAKRLRHEYIATTSKFKGVVLQLNGHWGAQIYVKKQRIWLGTFKSEEEAAMAYDSASIKLRNVYSFRNFPWTSLTVREQNFQIQFSIEEVVNMIKDGSYASRFTEYLNDEHHVELPDEEFGVSYYSVMGPGKDAYSCLQYFKKELTPSDVGKLNRLVIPKNSAIRYFPHASEVVKKGGGADGVQLMFYDKSLRQWEFRFGYWKSTQSYIFTGGWSEFVKAKGLKAKDTIAFSLCRHVDSVSVNGALTFNSIDLSFYDQYENNTGGVGALGEFGENVNEEFKEQEQVQELARYSDFTEEHEKPDGIKDSIGVDFDHSPSEKKGFRLFGVEIN